MSIKCIIVDDEPLSRDVLETYIADHPDLDLTASCKDAFEAMATLEKEQVDLMFLDINMPKLSGINFYKSLSQKPNIVFTTAYPEFAVEGFELNATDYLLKPFSFERFIQEVNKVKERSKSPKSEGHILMKADKKMYKVDYDEILFFEALGDYVKAHLQDKVLIVTTTLKKLLAELPSDQFFQTHKSFIISKQKIAYVEGNQIKIADKTVGIGQAFKESVLRQIKN
jgi:DNA-binding LytR/AlgR family response regulator